MKTLKLNHTSASAVLDGSKRATWRINDDKNLSIDDEVELIDKVNPDEPSSWQAIGIATINEIVIKRLGEVNEREIEFTSQDEMYKRFEEYYGEKVGPHTPVKIINFEFEPYAQPRAFVGVGPISVSEVQIFGDGGSRGNPGPSASGYVVMDMDNNVLVREGDFLGIATNNWAEYHALKGGLEAALRLKAQTVHVYMDSLLVVNQMKGIYKVKHQELSKVYVQCVELAKKFKLVDYNHVPREFNTVADRMVNEILDKAASINP